MDISIIVPVYNVKNYLTRCVESLKRQTHQDLEIILIDDGSTDGSEILCDSYAAERHIKVIHQANAGLSMARNAGIAAANGEYLLFVDSDDYIEADACKRLLEEAQKYNCDIVCARAYIATEKQCYMDGVDRHGIKVPCSGKEFLVKSIGQKAMQMCAPYALYRTDVIRKNEIYFRAGILHEDELWTPQVYLNAQKVSYLSYPFYYHWMREGSITQSTWNEKHSRDIYFVCGELSRIYTEKVENLKERRILMDYVCMLYLNALNLIRDKHGNKKFLLYAAATTRNRLKALLYCSYPTLYFAVNPHKSMSKKQEKK